MQMTIAVLVLNIIIATRIQYMIFIVLARLLSSLFIHCFRINWITKVVPSLRIGEAMSIRLAHMASTSFIVKFYGSKLVKALISDDD